MLLSKLKTVACEQNINIFDGVYDWLEVARIKKQKIFEKNHHRVKEASVEANRSFGNNHQ